MNDWKWEAKQQCMDGWGYTERMRVSKGYPRSPYWLRTRSNPTRHHYH